MFFSLKVETMITVCLERFKQFTYIGSTTLARNHVCRKCISANLNPNPKAK